MSSPPETPETLDLQQVRNVAEKAQLDANAAIDFMDSVSPRLILRLLNLIERLRATTEFNNRGPNYEPMLVPPGELRLEAAAAIERLLDRIEGLEGERDDAIAARMAWNSNCDEETFRANQAEFFLAVMVACAEGEEEEAYQLGKRDGYESAVQDIDLLTGGDGEYRFCTDGDPDRHTPDADTMKRRIVVRAQSSEADNARLRGVLEAIVEEFAPPRRLRQQPMPHRSTGPVPGKPTSLPPPITSAEEPSDEPQDHSNGVGRDVRG